MIVFDLCCAVGDHQFEAWFASSASFADQQARALISCPICGDTEIEKAVMAPRLHAKSNQKPSKSLSSTPPSSNLAAETEAVRRLIAQVAAKQAEILPHSRWVGREFAAAARAMHEGRASEDLIHGQASPDEAEALREDGIAAMPLIVPVIPPDMAN